MNPVIRNIFWLLAEHGSRIVLSTISVSLMARALGVEQYGLLQYTLGLVAAFSSISFICGAEVLVPPLVTATPAERKRLMGNAFVLRQAASVVAYICLLIFAWVAEDRSNFLLITLVGITILLNESFAVVTAWLQSQTNMKPRAVLSVFSLVFRLAVVAILYYSSVQNIYFYALFYFLDSVIVATGLFFIYKQKSNETWFQYNLKDASELLKRGLPFWYGLIVAYFYNRIDLIMLNRFSDNYNLGIYSSALQLLSIIVASTTAIITSLAPRYIYGECNKRKARKNTATIAVLMFFISLCISMFSRLYGAKILHLLFGIQFDGAIPLFNKIIWAACVIAVDSSLNLYLIKEKKGKAIMAKFAFSLLVSSVVHFSFIPKFQAHGAIYGYISGCASACLFGLYIFISDKESITSSNTNEWIKDAKQ